MATEAEASVPVLAVTAAVGAVVLLLVLLCGYGRGKGKEEPEEEEKPESKPNGATHAKKQQPPKKVKPTRKETRATFTHPWLASSLKAHSSNILGLDFSPNGKYLATCAEDRTVLLWSVKEFNQKDHKSIRANIELDHPTQVKFSPDTKAFIVSLYRENTLRVLRLGKKPDGGVGNIQAAFDFPKDHDVDIINIGIASSGRFIMSCYKDTTIKIWNIKGEVLTTLDTRQGNNCYATVSLCGRFVGSAGFTPDVKVWEICFDKNGTFREASRAFVLKGHSAGVYCFAFNGDSTRMATVSKDGTWKLWNTYIEYQKGQDPYLMTTGQFNHTGPSLIALSHDSRTVAVATNNNISIYNSKTAEEEQTIADVHGAQITALAFDNSSKYLVSTGDKHVHVFHNIVGYQAAITDLHDQKKKAPNQSTKSRIQDQINEAQSALEVILGENQ